METPFVSVVVLNYNGREHLGPCLGSLRAQRYRPFETILVDNASVDGSVAFVRERFPEVRIVESGSNLGFAGGNNLGVEAARGRWIALLNNDARAADDWLEALVGATRGGAVPIVSSFVRTEGVPVRYYERNGSLALAGYNIMRVFHHPGDLFYPNGCACLFDREAIGLPFDPDYFLYAEDVHLGLRARFAGLELRHVPEARVEHVGSATSRRVPSARLTYFQERNRLLNLALFFDAGYQVRIVPFLLFSTLLRLSLAARRRASLRGLLRAWLWFPLHPGVIRRKRRELRQGRRVREGEIIRWMSGRVLHGDSAVERFLDRIALLYCRLVRLGTYELAGPGAGANGREQ